MLIFWRASLIKLRTDLRKIFNRFNCEIVRIDILAFTSFHGLISQLVRLLTILVDEPESFLELFFIDQIAGGTLRIRGVDGFVHDI